ncbi:uncharacterized protein CMC5_051390 [Chondromyces crocatus]|uniref:Uncharacterized protein n=2 Tax=Chondromyces crocatus TaxID=52 RepID=A0A0K1EJW8_CHOCO|nr:uncharacterized protein CMC5_051390 [Chondromyces crocatus]
MRLPTKAEVETIRERGRRREQALKQHLRGGGDALFCAALGGLVALLALFLLDGFPRGAALVFGVLLVVTGGLGFRAGRRFKQDRLRTAEAETEERLGAVEELRFEIERVMTVSSPLGDGEFFFLCALSSGRYVVLSSELWDPAQEFPEAWRTHVTLVLDGRKTIVLLDLEGALVEVERRDVRPPDFEVTEAHRFWEPPADLVLPGIVDEVDARPLDACTSA